MLIRLRMLELNVGKDRQVISFMVGTRYVRTATYTAHIQRGRRTGVFMVFSHKKFMRQVRFGTGSTTPRLLPGNPNEPPTISISVEGLRKCSSNAAQRENATTPTDSWGTTDTYITL